MRVPGTATTVAVVIGLTTLAAFHPMCGTRAALVFGSARVLPRTQPKPGSDPSSLPSLISCMPRQMPSNGMRS